MRDKKIELGQVLVTQGVRITRMENEDFKTFIDLSLHRHKKCDWGDVYPEDKDLNEYAFEVGERIMSVYEIPKEIETKNSRKIWIITEADRSTTTILYPNEY